MTVDLAKAKQHLNVTFDYDDELIGRQIAAATDFIIAQIGGNTANLSTDPAVDQAILMLTAHWYGNREATLVGVSAAPLPLGVQQIIDSKRAWSWGEPDE